LTYLLSSSYSASTDFQSQVSLLPGYNSEVGAAWLERGFAYAVANIRGGGEFGPDWHQVSRSWDRGAHKVTELEPARKGSRHVRDIAHNSLSCKGCGVLWNTGDSKHQNEQRQKGPGLYRTCFVSSKQGA
jgi:hypothetical protein